MAKQCLNQCCFCCTLETGGYIIGWINIIFGFLGLIGSVVLVVSAIVGLNQIALNSEDEAVLIAAVVVFSIYAVFALIYAIAGIFLVLGVKRREHRKIVLMLILMGIGVVLAFLNLFADTSPGAIVSSIIGALIQAYFFTCIYSLYAMIKNENTSKTYG